MAELVKLNEINVLVVCDKDFVYDQNYYYFLLKLLESYKPYTTLINVYDPEKAHTASLNFDLIVINKCNKDDLSSGELKKILSNLKINGYLYINPNGPISDLLPVKKGNDDFSLTDSSGSKKTFINHPIDSRSEKYSTIPDFIRINKETLKIASETGYKLNQELFNLLFTDLSILESIHPLLFSNSISSWLKVHEILYIKLNLNTIERFEENLLEANKTHIEAFINIIGEKTQRIILFLINSGNAWITHYKTILENIAFN